MSCALSLLLCSADLRRSSLRTGSSHIGSCQLSSLPTSPYKQGPEPSKTCPATCCCPCLSKQVLHLEPMDLGAGSSSPAPASQTGSPKALSPSQTRMAAFLKLLFYLLLSPVTHPSSYFSLTLLNAPCLNHTQLLSSPTGESEAQSPPFWGLPLLPMRS